MKKIKIVFVIATLAATHFAEAQELNARVTVNSSRVGNTVNKKTFQTLQNALNTFVNNRKWSTDEFATNEKIDCNFLLNLQQTENPTADTSLERLCEPFPSREKSLRATPG